MARKTLQTLVEQAEDCGIDLDMAYDEEILVHPLWAAQKNKVECRVIITVNHPALGKWECNKVIEIALKQTEKPEVA